MDRESAGKRIPNAAHESGPWRIREIAPDFMVEDVWALPVEGGAEDFQTLLELMAASDPANAESLPTRVLWRLRDRLGSWFDLGEIAAPADGRRRQPQTPPWREPTPMLCRCRSPHR